MEWPETRFGVVSPRDVRFPFPGMGGPDCLLRANPEYPHLPQDPEDYLLNHLNPPQLDILEEPTQGDLVQQYLDMAEEVLYSMVDFENFHLILFLYRKLAIPLM